MVSRFTLAILFMAIFLYDQCSAQICFHKKKTKKQQNRVQMHVFKYVSYQEKGVCMVISGYIAAMQGGRASRVRLQSEQLPWAEDWRGSGDCW